MQFLVRNHQEIAPTVFRMTLTGDTRGITNAGQFVQIALPGFYLRRPISICDWCPGESGTLEIIYKTVGHGTEALSAFPIGAELDLLAGLGNGYDLQCSGALACQKPLLVGGGVGAPPLYGLCKKLLEAGKKPTVLLGFNTAQEVFLQREFQALGVSCEVCTVDGSAGTAGFVTNGMSRLTNAYDYVFACGPEPMLKAVHSLCGTEKVGGQFSFEERMACGFGVCMGCSCKTRYGSKRICKDGPVLRWEEIVW